VIIRNTDKMTIAEMRAELAELLKASPEHARAYELRRVLARRAD
jgi:ferric-dicitrate binding protein FerR (iron transport regulator)